MTDEQIRLYAACRVACPSPMIRLDLRERGVAMLKDGKRYVPPEPRRPRIVFDEAPRT